MKTGSNYITNKLYTLLENEIVTEDYSEQTNIINQHLDALGSDEYFELGEIFSEDGTMRDIRSFEMTITERLMHNGWFNSDRVFSPKKNTLQSIFYKLFQDNLLLTWIKKEGDTRIRLKNIEINEETLEDIKNFWHLKLLDELSKSIKTEKDLAALSKHLLKLTVERAMDAELDEHLGYPKHAVEGKNAGNSRNGYSSKSLKGNFGEVEISTPRDRNSTFEPQLIRKGQTRITEFDEQILALYARGMTTRDIAATFKEMYGAEVSHSLIYKVTEAVERDKESTKCEVEEPAKGVR
jgi:hypothetical protein